MIKGFKRITVYLRGDKGSQRILAKLSKEKAIPLELNEIKGGISKIVIMKAIPFKNKSGG